MQGRLQMAPCERAVSHSWPAHVGFTPDSERIAATQRTDALGDLLLMVSPRS